MIRSLIRKVDRIERALTGAEQRAQKRAAQVQGQDVNTDEVERMVAARSSLEAFTLYTMPTYQVNWHHRVMFQYLERWINGEIPRLILFMPPRSGKSEIASRRGPAYILGKNPDAQIISCSYGATLASRMNRDVQRILDQDEYHHAFPGTRLMNRNVRTIAQEGTWLRNSDMFEIVGHRGMYRGSGVGGGITGLGFDFGIIDDVIKSAAEAQSPTYRESIWEWYSTVFYTRQSKDSRILLVMTRWHHDDLAGRLLDQARRDPSADQWVVVKFPAVAGTDILPDDSRAPGESLWRERFTEQFLTATRAQLSAYEWGAVYQQEPSPSEGGLFKLTHFRYFSDIVRDGKLIAFKLNRPGEQPPERPFERSTAHFSRSRVLDRRHCRSRALCPYTQSGASRPLVMDFGLALRGEAEVTMTLDGHVIGTPAYMSPEQAAGKGHEADARSDVYSLGVILYETLTGELPFRGTRAMMLAKVIQDEPTPLRKSNDKIPRDLETVCLKCLRKEPGRRYQTARELAEDLRRWLNAEPVTARPVGKLERGWRWCKRNPGMAGMAAAVGGVLLLGTLTSTLLATKERWERKRAERAERDAVFARDELELTLSRSLLGPLDPNRKVGDTLIVPEADALWTLAVHNDQRLHIRVLDEATRDHKSRRQLLARPEPLLIAALGVDPTRRARAAELFTQKMEDSSLDLTDRAGIALVSLQLDDGVGPEADKARSILSEVLSSKNRGAISPVWSSHVSRDVCGLQPKGAARLVSVAFPREVSVDAKWDLAHRLSQLAPHLEPDDAATLCGPIAVSLALAIERERDNDARWKLAESLTRVGKYCNSHEAARIFSQALERERTSNVLGILVQGLAACTTGRELLDAARLLSAMLDREENAGARVQLAGGLVAVAPRLDSSETTRVCGLAVPILAEAMEREHTARGRARLGRALAAVAVWLERREVVATLNRCARLLLAELERVTDSSERDNLAEALAAMAGQLDPADVVQTCGRAAQLLAAALEQELPDNNRTLDRHYTARGLVTVAARLDPGEATRLIAVALERERDPLSRHALAAGLARMAAHLSSAEAARACGPAARRLAEAFDQERNDLSCGWLGDDLGAVSALLDPLDSTQLCSHSLARYIRAGLTPDSDNSPVHIEAGVARLVNRLDDVEARRLARELAMLLSAYPEKNDDSVYGRLSRERHESLRALLVDDGRGNVSNRRASTASAFGVGCAGPLTTIVLVRAAGEPFPCRLTTQELVELLKMPTCFGPTRRVVLDQLGNRYRRHFFNHWAFVRYAREHGLNLDFTTPPKRPNRTVTWPGEFGTP